MRDQLATLGPYFAAAFSYGLVPLMVFSAICVAPVFVYTQLEHGRKGKGYVLTALIFAVIGAALGLMVGSSRESAVGAFIPGLLTLLGALVIYILPEASPVKKAIMGLAADKDAPQLDPMSVRFGLLSLIVASVMASNFGASVRQAAEIEQRDYDRYLLSYEKVQLPVELDALKAAMKPAGEAPEQAATPCATCCVPAACPVPVPAP